MFDDINEKLQDVMKPVEWRYALLGQDGATDQQPTSTRWRRGLKIAACIIPFWFFLIYLNWHRPSVLRKSASTTAHDTHIQSAFAHLVIPATTGSISFCRTLFSAGALNYPTPRIINWERKYEQPNQTDGGFHLAKIGGILDFLQKLDAKHDHELVLIVNGYDTWFQLRPEVLLERYHAVNKRSHDYVWPRYGLKYEQTVLFSAQKHCEGDANDWSCALAPPSTLPANIYGANTDQPVNNIMNQWENHRARYLNADLVIGPVGALKPLYEYAKWKLDQHPNHYQTDREIFSSIFGEQEYFREKTLFDSDREAKPKTDPRNNIVNSTKVDLHCERCQFGIGLDYEGALSAPQIYSEHHYQHITFTSTSKHRIDPVISHSTPPHWTPDYTGATILPPASWANIPLHTNKNTGIVPATTSHPPQANLTTLWDQQWYHPNLRTLASAHAKSFRIPFAVIQLEESGKTQEYWGPNDGYGGVRLHETGGMPGKWRQWDELCGGEEVGREVFGDGLGKYQCPVYFLYWDGKKQKQQLETWDQMQAEEKRREEVQDRAGFVSAA
jgi:hypothetical protein